MNRKQNRSKTLKAAIKNRAAKQLTAEEILCNHLNEFNKNSYSIESGYLPTNLPCKKV